MKRFIVLTPLLLIALISLVRADDYILGAGLYDDTAPVFTYDEEWSNVANVNHYLGSAHFGTTIDSANPSFAFSIYGNTFTLFITRFPFGGDVLVCIDGICSNLSAYAAGEEYQVAITYSGLSIGQHDITITIDSGDFMFDALLVEPSPITAATATPSPTPTFTPEFTATPTATPTALPYVEYQITNSVGESQTVRFEYSVTAGQAASILMQFTILIVLLIGLVAGAWRYFNDNR